MPVDQRRGKRRKNQKIKPDEDLIVKPKKQPVVKILNYIFVFVSIVLGLIPLCGLTYRYFKGAVIQKYVTTIPDSVPAFSVCTYRKTNWSEVASMLNRTSHQPFRPLNFNSPETFSFNELNQVSMPKFKEFILDCRVIDGNTEVNCEDTYETKVFLNWIWICYNLLSGEAPLLRKTDPNLLLKKWVTIKIETADLKDNMAIIMTHDPGKLEDPSLINHGAQYIKGEFGHYLPLKFNSTIQITNHNPPCINYFDGQKSCMKRCTLHYYLEQNKKWPLNVFRSIDSDHSNIKFGTDLDTDAYNSLCLKPCSQIECRRVLKMSDLEPIKDEIKQQESNQVIIDIFPQKDPKPITSFEYEAKMSLNSFIFKISVLIIIWCLCVLTLALILKYNEEN